MDRLIVRDGEQFLSELLDHGIPRRLPARGTPWAEWVACHDSGTSLVFYSVDTEAPAFHNHIGELLQDLLYNGGLGRQPRWLFIELPKGELSRLMGAVCPGWT